MPELSRITDLEDGYIEKEPDGDGTAVLHLVDDQDDHHLFRVDEHTLRLVINQLVEGCSGIYGVELAP